MKIAAIWISSAIAILGIGCTTKEPAVLLAFIVPLLATMIVAEK